MLKYAGMEGKLAFEPRRPLVWIAVFMASGIAAANVVGLPVHIVLAIAWLLSLAALLCCISTTNRFNWLLVFAAVFALGSVLATIERRPQLARRHVIWAADGGEHLIEGTVASWPEGIGGSRARAVVKVRAFGGSPASGFILITYDAEKTPAGLSRGDAIVCRAKVRLPDSFKNPGSFDYRRYLERKNIYVIGYAGGGMIIVRKAGTLCIWRIINRYREKIRRIIHLTSSLEGEGVLRALVLGERRGLDRNAVDQYAKMGIYHLFVVSGLHMAGIAFVFYWLFSKMLAPLCLITSRVNIRALAAVLTMVPVVFYALATGAQLPAFRAAVMVSVYLLAVALGRERDLLSSVATAAIVIFFVSPLAIFQASFQLSFAAVIFIAALLEVVLWRRPADKRWQGDPQKLSGTVLFAFLVSCAAFLGTAPLTAYYFNYIAMASPLVNVFFIPYVALLLLPLALAGSWVGLLNTDAGKVLMRAAGSLADLLDQAAAVAYRYCPMVGDLRTPRLHELAMIYVAFAVLYFAAVEHRTGRRRKFLAMAAVLFLAFIGLQIVAGLVHPGKGRLRATFFDVGRADSILIRFPYGGEAMLVDGGGFRGGLDMGRFVVARALLTMGLRRIDYVVATHGHLDHCGGLAYILERFHPKELWISGSSRGIPLMEELTRMARERSMKVVEVKASPEPRTIGGAEVFIVNPGSQTEMRVGPESEEYHHWINDQSIVMKISYGGRSILLASDIEESGQREILSRFSHCPRLLRADVMEAPHHGASSFFFEPFLLAVRPLFVVLSTECRPGRPFCRKQAAAYGRSGACAVCTGDVGAITFSFNRAGELRCDVFNPGRH